MQTFIRIFILFAVIFLSGTLYYSIVDKMDYDTYKNSEYYDYNDQKEDTYYKRPGFLGRIFGSTGPTNEEIHKCEVRMNRLIKDKRKLSEDTSKWPANTFAKKELADLEARYRNCERYGSSWPTYR